MNKIVLIIEDDAGLNELLNEKVQQCGYETASFFSAQKAFDWLKTNTPFLILLDYSLPDMTGKDFINELKLKSKTLPPFILSTGRGDERIAVEMMKLGARDYVVKDNNFLELISVIVRKVCAEIESENKLFEIELALNESHKFNNQVIKNVHEGVVVYDQNFRYLIWNPFMEELTGINAPDIIGRCAKEVFPFLHDAGEINNVEKALQGKYVKSIEFEYNFPISGKKGWVSDATSALTNVDGKIVGAISTVRDITERKKAEESIQLVKQSYYDIFNSVSEAIYILDDTFTFIEVNKGAEDMYQFTHNELIGKSPTTVAAQGKNDMDSIGQKLQMVSETGSTVSFEFWAVRKNGEIFPKEVIVNKGKYFGKEVLIATARDISERKKAEEAIHQSEELYRNLVLRLPDGVYKSTSQGKFVDVNPAMVTMLGYDSKEDLLSIDIKKQLYFNLTDRETGKLNNDNEEMAIFQLKKKDGSGIWVEDHGWYNSDSDGNIIHHEGVLRDVTERKQAQDYLEESEAMLNKLLFASSEFIDSGSDEINYGKMTNIMSEISGAKYGTFNLADEVNSEFTTVAIFGLEGVQSKIKAVFGSDLMHRKWKMDSLKTERIKQSTITKFDSIYQMAQNVLPKPISMLIEKTFHVQRAYVVKIIKDNKYIGDFTLLFAKGTSLRYPEIVELFANQIGLFIDRENTNKELRLNEEKYRYLFANNPQPMWIYDLETLYFVEVNQAAVTHYGYSREEFLAMKITQIRPTEDIPSLIEDVKHTELKFNSRGEWRHVKKNGSVIHVEITSACVYLNGRESRHVMVQDITERKFAEDNLRESEEKFRTITEQLSDLISIVDNDGIILYASQAAKSIFQVEPDAMCGQKFVDFLDKNDIPKAMDAFYKGMVLGEQVVDLELNMKRKDGTIFSGELNGSNFKFEGQNCSLVVIRDISERKQGENNLRDSEEKFRSITEQVSEFISTCDLNGTINYASPASKSLFLCEPEEMNGHNFIEFLHEESVQTAVDAFSAGVDGKKKAIDLELTLKRKDGTFFYGELNGSKFSSKEHSGILVVVRDITERKTAEAELQQKMDELMHFQRLTVGREMTMIDLKKEVNELLLKNGKDTKYRIVE